MWLVISGDGDIDYTHVYGPFGTQADAEAALPNDTDDIAWRAVKLENLDQIVHEAELLEDDDEQQDTSVNASTDVHLNTFPANIQPLIDRYGSLDNIPAPNPDVRLYANSKVTQIAQQIRNGQEINPDFGTGEGSELAYALHSLGINLNATPQEAQAVAQLHLEHRYYQELAVKHRPRIGF